MNQVRVRQVVSWTCAVLALLITGYAMGGPLIVFTDPPYPDARVLVDGIPRGTTDAGGKCIVYDIPEGEVDVVVVLPDLRRHSGTRGISRGDTSSRHVASFDPVGYLIVRANVADVIVSVDEKEVGSITEPNRPYEFLVDPGWHVIAVAKSGFAPQAQELDVRANDRIDQQFILVRNESRGFLTNLDSDIAVWALVAILAVGVGTVTVLAFVVVRQSLGQRVTSRTIDRYQLKGQIGRGGMATVFRALDTTKRRSPTVALKVLDRSYLHDADMVRKFLREGEILEQIAKHDPDAPVVRVLRYGRADAQSGRPFLALELVEGENLLSFLGRRGPMPRAEAITIVSGVARALIPAHECGIYHRDLTPDNVILTRKARGGHRLRLIDFGVARHEYTSHGTLDGSIAGKPPFMSPEQCRGTAVDSRSDVYSLGVLLYTLVHGSPPFTGVNPLDVMRMHQDEPVIYSDSVDAELRGLLVKALDKTAAQRYPDARAFLGALEAI